MFKFDQDLYAALYVTGITSECCDKVSQYMATSELPEQYEDAALVLAVAIIAQVYTGFDIHWWLDNVPEDVYRPYFDMPENQLAEIYAKMTCGRSLSEDIKLAVPEDLELKKN